jgi:hypothetical protein
MIVHQQAIGVEVLIESHGFELALPQAGHCDDVFLEVYLDDFAAKVPEEQKCLR